MATSAQFQAVLATLSADEFMRLKNRLNADQRMKLVNSATLSTVELNALCTEIAAVFPPTSVALLAII